MQRTEMKRTGGFFKDMLEGLKSSVGLSQSVKHENEIEETLQREHFQVLKTVRHGFPFLPTAVAFDPIQRILAIGTRTGSLKILGKPGVECHVHHLVDLAVIQIVFLVNEGALISVCSDDTLHLWNLRQKRPEILHSLKFQRERITYCHLPFQSKWLYIGTERGNVYTLNVESFVLSGYVIHWNKAIKISQKTHPGCVVHLSENPVDANKLLIAFETGTVVLWDLRNRAVEMRLENTEHVKSVSWHHDGKQLMCSHINGSLSTWNIKMPMKPITVVHPHLQPAGNKGKPELCKPIYKVEWKTVRRSDAYIIFTGGHPYEKTGKTSRLTVLQGNATTVLEMDSCIVDFVTLCESPWQNDFQEPYAVVVVLNNELVVVDLTTEGFPSFPNLYPMDLHESPVTFCTYLTDCSIDFIPALFSVGSKRKKHSGFSKKEWPISGGEWGTGSDNYSELIITGHADGSLKFWDASSVSLQFLYKLKSSKIFEQPKTENTDYQEDEPFAIEQIFLCSESRILCIAGASSHVVMFTFNQQETDCQVTVLEIPIVYEVDDDPECSLQPVSEQGTYSSAFEESAKQEPTAEYYVPLKVKSSSHKRHAGFQAELVCLTPWVDGEIPGHITALSVNSSYGLMAYGNECGLVVVDLIQKTCLLNMGTPDLYGSADPYRRVARSPKRNNTVAATDIRSLEHDSCCSPSPDQSDNLADTCDSQLSFSQSALYLSSVRYNSSSQYVINDNSERSLQVPERKAEKDHIKEFSCKSNYMTENLNYKLFNQDNLEQKLGKNTKSHEPLLRTKSLPAGGQGVFNFTNSGCVQKRRYTFRQKSCVEFVDLNQVAENKEHEEQRSSQVKRKKNVKKDLKPHICHSDYWHDDVVDDGKENEWKKRQKESVKREKKKTKHVIIDLRNDAETPTLSMIKICEKIDSSFSWSRSSSVSSLENVSAEVVQWLCFADSFSNKSDPTTSPSLWVGTSLGSILVILLTFPSDCDHRLTHPVIVSPSGTIYRLKESIVSLAFLDSNGALIPYPSGFWKDVDCNTKDSCDQATTIVDNISKNTNLLTPLPSEVCGNQFVVMVSEKQARVMSVPSQSCVSKANITDTSFVVCAKAVTLKSVGNVCLACFIANGNIVVYSLPSLRLLYEVHYLSVVDMRTIKTFCFSTDGHGLYLCSASEIQKFSISSSFSEILQDMLSTVFVPKDMPEAPRRGFFRGLFGGGPSTLDREGLFGERSGKASGSVAQHIPGNSSLEHVKAQTGSLAGELARARLGLTERGEALSQLEDKTAKMMSEAEHFSNTAHKLMLKYRDKKWYQF